MKLAISQPTFLPWAGYFGLLNFTDEFVFLDDVQYSKRGWQQRNCIKINNKSFNLSVPVISKNKYNQKINEVLIDNSKKFIDDHKKTIEHNYKKSKYYSSYVEEIFKIYDCKHQKLIDLNFDFIIKICELLKIKISFIKSSSLKTKSSKGGLILEICKLKQCNTYVSTIGAKDYLLNNSEEFKKNSIQVQYFKFKNSQYNQIGKDFIKNLSIIDLLFNLGPTTLDYINKNFYIHE